MYFARVAANIYKQTDEQALKVVSVWVDSYIQNIPVDSVDIVPQRLKH